MAELEGGGMPEQLERDELPEPITLLQVRPHYSGVLILKLFDYR